VSSGLYDDTGAGEALYDDTGAGELLYDETGAAGVSKESNALGFESLAVDSTGVA
jgi:hypothetical protein